MNRKIFLAGGGDENQSRAIDDLYGKTIGIGAEVLYVPVAWESEDKFDGCLEWFNGTYRRFDFKIEMLVNLDAINSTDLKRFKSIYIGGGNTFSLLKIIKETHFFDLLKEYIDAGGVVYGGSAGAIILGKDISTAYLGKCSDINHVGITDLSGLNVVNDYSIHCHYDGDRSEVEQFAGTNNLNVIALPEGAGIFIDGSEIKKIGDVVTVEGV